MSPAPEFSLIRGRNQFADNYVFRNHFQSPAGGSFRGAYRRIEYVFAKML